MFTSPRRNLNEDVVAFPASKTAGAATLSSSELYDFENTAFGAVNIHLMAADDADITDTLTIQPFVSFDEGTTWIQAGAYSDLANGAAGAISAMKSLTYVPRLRVDAVFDGTGALVAGHGATIDVDMREYEPAWARTFTADVDTLPATQLAGANVYNGTTITLEANTDKLAVIVKADDLSKVTDNITYMLQCSNDGTYWWDMWSSAKTDFANGTGILYSENDMDAGAVVGAYARVNFTSDGTGALAADHGGAAHLLGFSS